VKKGIADIREGSSNDDEALVVACLTTTTLGFPSSNRLYIYSQEEVLEFGVHVVSMNNGVISVVSRLN